MLFAVVVVQCGFSLPTAAQIDRCTTGGYQFFCGDQLQPGTISCSNEGPCLDVCFKHTNQCVPAAAPSETCPTCQRAAAGNQISLASGNTDIEQTDINLPGLSHGLSLVRTWNSKWPATQSAFQIGLFGPNWRSTFEERVFVGTDSYVKYARSDGSFWSFGISPGGNWGVAAPANVSATLTEGTAYWTLKLQNGEQRQFDNNSGNLTTIIDRNGNTTQLSYDTAARLVTITDPASRHLYLTYQNSSSHLVTGITSDVGLTLSYSYDTPGRLILVTKPDQTTLSFEYDVNSLITSVKDSNGKILESHTYDSAGRGLTSSRAGGVEAFTLSPN